MTESMESSPRKLVDLVSYQGSSVVSQALVKKKAGSVRVFAFAEGEGLSEHTAPFDAVVQILEGEVRLTLSGVDHHLAAGEIIIMPAGAPHALHSEGRFKMLLTMIRE
jgi:quercetin dioxygenase-like cupin family protein